MSRTDTKLSLSLLPPKSSGSRALRRDDAAIAAAPSALRRRRTVSLVQIGNAPTSAARWRRTRYWVCALFDLCCVPHSIAAQCADVRIASERRSVGPTGGPPPSLANAPLASFRVSPSPSGTSEIPECVGCRFDRCECHYRPIPSGCRLPRMTAWLACRMRSPACHVRRASLFRGCGCRQIARVRGCCGRGRCPCRRG